LVDDRVGRFRMDKGTKVLYLRAAAGGQAAGVPRAGQDERTTFGIAIRAWDSETVVFSTYGDIDAVTAPELEQELLEAAQLGARRVVVDLTEATFFDSSAIHALTRSEKRFQAIDLQLDIVCGSRQTKKVLEITGVSRALPIHATIQQAISHKPAPDISLVRRLPTPRSRSASKEVPGNSRQSAWPPRAGARLAAHRHRSRR
jgi:anti-sigma B factor antagonist